ncbi:peptidoglycan-binding domain-containing protein [Acetobacterium malicum]|uniref:peptidoglycan-binding domain-containing protein n=1 Tax=Acetobacterium malicum TaxID=52692 RepID=UPI00047A5F7B|nr:peptidoglycan-binding protein [Acetobacterium dehalogenans]
MNKQTPFKRFKDVILYIVFTLFLIFLTSSFVIEDVYSAADQLSMEEHGISDVYSIAVGMEPANLTINADTTDEDQKTTEIKTDDGTTIVITEYALGDTNDEILEYQQILYSLGFLISQPSNQITEEVQTAIKTYQAMKGLEQSGKLDRSTIISLVAEDIKFEKGDSGKVLQTYQQILVAQKYLAAEAATGTFDDATETAVKAFQKANGLTETGKMDAKTIKALDALR